DGSTVAGTVRSAPSPAGSIHTGFVWDHEGGLQPIGNISPMDISADGAVIVGSAGPGHSSPKQPPHNDISAAWWSLEETLLIEDFLALTGISADGTVGAASSLGGPSFLWTKQGIVNLGDL